MPKQRAAGAAKPYRYWHTYKVVGEDGKTVTRRSQRWMVRLDLGYDSSGRRIRRTITGKTSEAVKEKLREARAELAETGTVDRAKVKLGDYAHQWLEHKSREADPKTIEMYRTVIDRHLDRYAGLPLAKIVPSTVRRILEEAQAYDQKGSPKGPAGVSLKRQIRTCLNQVMQAAWADRLIPSNPVLAVKTPSRKDQGEGRSAFSVPELRSMLDVSSRMPVEEGTIWWWRLLTGMRQGEILGATWDSLNMRTGVYTVDWKLQTVTKAHGCGEPDHGAYPCGRRNPALCPDARWLTPDGYDMRPPVRLLRTHPAQVAHRQDRAHRAAAHGGHAPLPEGHQGHPQPVRAHLPARGRHAHLQEEGHRGLRLPHARSRYRPVQAHRPRDQVQRGDPPRQSGSRPAADPGDRRTLKRGHDHALPHRRPRGTQAGHAQTRLGARHRLSRSGKQR